MKIPVARLTASPSEFDFAADAAWWRSAMPASPGAPREAPEPIAFRLTAHRMGEDLLLEGRAEAVLQLECSRCLARYRHGLREVFRLVLEPAGGRTPADPEAAQALVKDGVCLGDEIEVGWYRGNEIDLDAFFREVVSLALPVKPLCKEDCAGLCPHCGIDLSERTCDCRETKVESPFAALAALRDGPSGGGN
ncbi:MAG: DUF177 domain-containing protein [Myxococcota bacterium]